MKIWNLGSILSCVCLQNHWKVLESIVLQCFLVQVLFSVTYRLSAIPLSVATFCPRESMSKLLKFFVFSCTVFVNIHLGKFLGLSFGLKIWSISNGVEICNYIALLVMVYNSVNVYEDCEGNKNENAFQGSEVTVIY